MVWTRTVTLVGMKRGQIRRPLHGQNLQDLSIDWRLSEAPLIEIGKLRGEEKCAQRRFKEERGFRFS